MITLGMVLAIVLAVISLFGTIELMFLTLGAWLYKAQPYTAKPGLKLAVVIPAHNEGKQIARTVHSVQQCLPTLGEVQIYVIADNCSDDTASQATQAGAQVLQRDNPQQRGKGYALDFAFNYLLAKTEIEAIIVIDADTVVATNFLQIFEQQFASGAMALQCRYTVNNYTATLRTRLLNIALLAFNVLRPRGREYWQLSVGISGNGFGLTRQVLQQVPYTANSIVEDLEYHLRLVRAGFRVRFVDNTSVWADMPVAAHSTKTQRARWEGGRLRMMREHIPQLARNIWRGNYSSIEPMLDLMLLPLAWHVLIILLLLLFNITQIYAIFALLIVILHVIIALWLGKSSAMDVLVLLFAPVYILWKLTLLPLTLKTAAKNAAWIRTDRDKS